MDINAYAMGKKLEEAAPLINCFQENVRNQVITMFENEGISVDDSAVHNVLTCDVHWFLMLYSQYLLSKVKICPRVVHTSRELNQKISVECRGADWIPIINIIKQKIEDGRDINPYLGRLRDQYYSTEFKITPETNFTVRRPQQTLYGIDHLHLSDKLKHNTQYYKRSGNLLLAFFTDTDAFLIDVASHSEWYSRKPLQIIEDHWPHILAPWRMHVDFLCLANGSTVDVDDATIEALTKAGVTTGIPLKNGVYLAHYGLVSSRHNMRSVLIADDIFNNISLLAMDVLQKGAMSARCEIASDHKTLIAFDSNSVVITSRPIFFV